MDEHHRYLLALMLAATVGLYASAMWAPWVYEDANYQRAWSQPAIWAVPTQALAVQSLRLTGASSLGAHLVNLGLHLMNGALVAAIGSALVGATAGLIAAAVLLWTPWSAGAVAYGAGRPDLLLGFWTLVSIWAALRFVDTKGLRWGLLAVGACGLALASSYIGAMALLLVSWTLFSWRPGRLTDLWLLASWGLGVGFLVIYGPVMATWQAAPFTLLPLEGPQTWWQFVFLQSVAVGLQVGSGGTPEPDVLGAAWAAPLAVCALTYLAVWGIWTRDVSTRWAIGWVGLALAPRFVFATNEWLSTRDLYPALVGPSLWAGARLSAWAGMPLMGRKGVRV